MSEQDEVREDEPQADVPHVEAHAGLASAAAQAPAPGPDVPAEEATEEDKG